MMKEFIVGMITSLLPFRTSVRAWSGGGR